MIGVRRFHVRLFGRQACLPLLGGLPVAGSAWVLYVAQLIASIPDYTALKLNFACKLL